MPFGFGLSSFGSSVESEAEGWVAESDWSVTGGKVGDMRRGAKEGGEDMTAGLTRV